MTFSTIISNENDITIPTPTLSTELYPVVISPTITQGMMEITILYDTIVDVGDNICSTTLCKNNSDLYYYCQNNTTLYDASKKLLWSLSKKDWHGMILSYRHTQVVLSTEEFNFSLNSQLYQWKLIPYKEENHYALNCYSNQQLVAQLNHTKFKIEIPNETTNPFKVNDNPLITFIILSGLIVQDHVKSLLKSLGNDPEALKTVLYFNKSHNGQVDYDNYNEEDDDVGSLSSSDLRHHYPGHRGLVDSGDRWSTAQSFKSIELNPSIWHWWHKIWWSCFPCCMPGGCCDRVCVRLKGHDSSSSRSLARKGWQQHY